MGPDQEASGIQAGTGKDPISGRFLPGHKPYIVKGNVNGRRGRPGKDYVQAWDWAKAQKPLVVKKLVEKAIAGHHPSIELYLAYVDGRPVETFKTTSLTVNVSAEDIKELAEKVTAHAEAFKRELGISSELLPGAASSPIAEIIADAARTPETSSP